MSLKLRFFLWGVGVVLLSTFLGVRWHLFLSQKHLLEFWEIVLTLIPFLLLLIVPLWVAMEKWVFCRLERIAHSNKQVGKGNLQAGFIVEETARKESQTRKILQKMLKDIGYRVLVVQDGEEGLKLFQEKKDIIDGVLTDMVMPKMGGDTLIIELRKREATLPIVVLSGYPLEPTEGNQDLSEKGVWFLQKPPALEALSGILYRALQSGKKKRERKKIKERKLI